MKKVLFSAAIILISLFSLTSCEENNYYELEDDTLIETLDIVSIKQVFEESRDEFNWEITYENNSRIGGEVLLQLVDQNGEPVYEGKKILTKNNGTFTTGKLYRLTLEDFDVIIQNTEKDYFYALSDETARDNQYREVITPMLGDFEFKATIEANNSLSSGGRRLFSKETIEISGGRADLKGIRLYKKFEDLSLKPWEIYSQISISFLKNLSRNASEEDNWVEHGNGYYSIEISSSNWSFSSLFFQLNSIDIYEYINSVENNVALDTYTEYVFEDNYDFTYEFQTPERSITITLSPNIDDVEVDINDIEAGKDVQEVAEITAEVVHTDVQLERTDVYMTMDENPWQTFTTAQLKLTKGLIVTINNLDNSNNWDSLGNNKYRLRISGYADQVEAGDDIEHEFSMEPNSNAKEMDIKIYFNIRYTDINGVTNTFETDEEELEVED